MTVHVTTLDNGLRIVSDTNVNVESVSIGVWVQVGTRDESEDVNGVAHFLEHMAFKGTESRTAKDIAEEIEAVGGDINAYTSMEMTAYHARVLKEDVTVAVDILSDILQHSTFDTQEFTREQSVILQEIGQVNDTPDEVVHEAFQHTCFKDQAIGRSILGTHQSIESMTREKVMQFMVDNYSADRMVLSAAGHIDHDTLVDLAMDRFANLKQNQPLNRKTATYHGGEWRKDSELEQVHLILGFPGASYHDPEYYTASVLSVLLGGGMSSRLFQEVRENRGLAYAISSHASSYQDAGVFAIYAGTSQLQANELIAVVCEELKRLPASLCQREIERAKAQLKAGLMMSLESTSARCRQIAQHVLIHGRPLAAKEILAKVECVDHNKITNLAQQIFSAKPTLAALGPISDLKPYESFCENLH